MKVTLCRFSKTTERQQKKHRPSKPFTFKVGEFLSISSNRRTFQRDYKEKWTEEVFFIKTTKYQSDFFLPIKIVK